MTHDHAADPAAHRTAHRVAVIGHGPAATSTSDLLICMGDYFVDLFSPAPAPTCLIRFGSTHRAPAEGTTLVPRLRLFGNVQVGPADTAVTVGELTHYYDTVVVAADTASLVIVGNSPEATATYEFLRAHSSLPLSRTPVVTLPAAADTPGAIVALLESRPIPFTTWTGWHRPAWASHAFAADTVVTVAQWRTLIACGRAVPAVP